MFSREEDKIQAVSWNQMPIAPNCLTLLLIKCKISGSLWGLLLLRGSRQGFLRRIWGGISQCPVVSYVSHWDKEFTDSWENVFYGCIYRCFWKKPIFECEDLAGPKLLRSAENTMAEEWQIFLCTWAEISILPCLLAIILELGAFRVR